MAEASKVPSQALTSPGLPQAGIVGAGIGGLSAAIALRRAGWRVRVWERIRLANEMGAAITCAPNATCALDRWGFDFAAAGAVPNQQTRYGASNLAIFFSSTYPDMAAKMGYGAWSLHRADLHQGLRDLATRPAGGEGEVGGKGLPVELELGCARRSNRLRGRHCSLGGRTFRDSRLDSSGRRSACTIR